MIPYCDRKWYHIDWEYGTIFFGNISLFQTQKGYDSISILAFSILKMLPFAFLTLSFFQFKGIEMRLVSYPFSLKIQYVLLD